MPNPFQAFKLTEEAVGAVELVARGGDCSAALLTDAMNNFATFHGTPVGEGIASYLNALADASPLGRITANVGASEIRAASAIMLDAPTVKAGEAFCANPQFVRQVATLVKDGHIEDYTKAFRFLQQYNRVVASEGML